MPKRKMSSAIKPLGFVVLAVIALIALIPLEGWIAIAIAVGLGAMGYGLVGLLRDKQAKKEERLNADRPVFRSADKVAVPLRRPPGLTGSSGRPAPAAAPAAPAVPKLVQPKPPPTPPTTPHPPPRATPAAPTPPLEQRRPPPPSESPPPEVAREFKVPPAPKGFGSATWVPRGTSIKVAGVDLHGGMVYVGTRLPTPLHDNDPCLIDPSRQVASHGDYTVREMGYWPSYSTISPTARRAYLNWLAGGRRDPEADVGYVFLFFYGLERRAIIDAAKDDSAKADWPVIAEELRRLLAIYGDKSGSFRSYAASLLDWVSLAAHPEKAYLQPVPQFPKWLELPLYIRVALGQAAVDRAPVPSELALAWAKLDPSINLRTPATRCSNEFDKLFVRKYRERFGEGSRTYQLRSGDYSAVVASGHGVDGDQFARRSEQFDLSAGSQAELPVYASEALHQTGLGWWALKDSFERVLARQLGVAKINLPSHVVASASVSVSYFFGVPRSASYRAATMDAKLDQLSVVPTAAMDATGRQAQKAFLKAAGSIGSHLEGAVFEALGATPVGTAASTTSLLNAANNQGVRLYELTTSNAAALNLLTLPSDVVDEVSVAIQQGLTVTVPQTEVTLGGYSGVGYVIEDPETGSAAYQIDGGRSGASGASASATVVPVPIARDTPLLRILVRGVLRQAAASLVVEGGAVVGIALGGAAVIAAQIIALILAAILIYTLVSQAIQGIRDETYPRTSRLYRHYTSAMAAIVASGMLISRRDGATYGTGIYVADAVDERQRGAGCPVNALDVTTRFQIPRPGQIDPSAVTGFIEIEIKRENYAVVTSHPRDGQIEYVIRHPLVPTTHPRDGSPAVSLLFVPDFIELSDVCF